MKGLYVIIDPEHCAGRDPVWVAAEALAGGAVALQLRAKVMNDAQRLSLARELRRLTRERAVPFWMNDRLDLALLSEADGLHLGQEDLPLDEARKLAGSLRLGLSTHSMAQAERALQTGADVLGFGPVFPTRSKERPDPTVGLTGLREVCGRVAREVVAIGGITLASAGEVAASGASYAAVIGAVCGAESPRAAAAELQARLLAG